MRVIQLSIISIILIATGLLSYVLLQQIEKNQTPELQVGTVYPDDFREIYDFNLITNVNESYNKDNFADKWTLLFFGFTHCPDICPASLVTFQQIEQRVNSEINNAKLDYVFVSVDPDRDTPEKIHEYTTYFSPNFKGVTGEKDQIERLTRSLAAFYQVPENASDDNYLVEHTASIYLISESARPKVLFSYPHDTDKIAEDVIKLLKS